MNGDQDRNEAQGRVTLSLPKGGGAIRSIGEKFSANAASGTAALSVPVPLTPGRGGFTPDLTLRYDSGRGNGPFGLGWGIGIPSITRKTDKRLPRYRDGQEADTFILSDMEDLVPTLAWNGTSWQRDEFSVTEAGTTFQVHRYRPRIESAFARIERWEDAKTGLSHWRTIGRDNVKSRYGVSTSGRIFDPADPRRTFEWLLEERSDDRGNAISYEYKVENADNVDRSLPQEGNRPPSSSGFAKRYLKRVRYANRRPHERSDWLLEAVLDYGDHQPSQPTPDEDTPWACRVDPFSNYRPGFEIRSYRLCRRVLMFHRFPELGAKPLLVRSVDLAYRHQPGGSTLTGISQAGYRLDTTTGGYHKSSLPPLELGYGEPVIDSTVRTLDSTSAENLPVGIDGANYEFVDLDGEGLAGILTQQASAWYYKRNLGHGRFAPAQVLNANPVGLAPGPGGGRQQLVDLDGGGHKSLVQFRPPAPGFFERTAEEGWEDFVAFRTNPNVDWSDPNLRLVDLDGDGRTDLLISEEACFTWYASAGRLGFEPAESVFKATDEERGPALVFAEAMQSVYLADMSGDGLSDIVRVRNDEVCYWPNLGYGNFGPKVAMQSAPSFDHPDLFEPRRVRLADIDGSGTSDIVYVGRDAVTFWINQSGNGWGEAHELPAPPHVDNLVSLDVVDLFGNGTACLVWSSSLPADAGRALRYVDLMSGKKPYLLERIANNLGGETRLAYTASTSFYRADAEAFAPWATKLPFPIHCLSRVETMDWLSRTKLVTEYSYHHGYFDGVEREFRGFGRVDQRDAEDFGRFRGAGLFSGELSNADAEFRLPPVVTKTWFHTGADPASGALPERFRPEYYHGDPAARRLPPTSVPSGLRPAEEREAWRALKGSAIRTEIFALDGTSRQDRPYQVSDHRAGVLLVQPVPQGGATGHAVFQIHDGEALVHHYERDPSDPRVSHQVVLDVDPFGNVTKAASIAYPRRATPAAPTQQSATLVTVTEASFVNKADRPDWLRLGAPLEASTLELTGAKPSSGKTFSRADLLGALAAATSISYEEDPTPGVIQKRLIEQARTLYRKDDLSAALPMGQLESLGLGFETYKLALTPGLVSRHFGAEVDDSVLRLDGGYVKSADRQADGLFPTTDPAGLWWLPSGRQFYDAATAPDHFYLPRASRDPFGRLFKVDFDAHDLLPVRTEDPVGNVASARIDYRVVQADMITDANGNRVQASFDALGMVVGTAVMGKTTDAFGDSLAGFDADLGEAVMIAHADSPLSTPEAILQSATTRLVYDPWRYHRTKAPLPDGGERGEPAVVYTLAREKHAADLDPGEIPRIQHSFTYAGGLGQELMTKVRAEPGPAPVRGADGVLHGGAAEAFTSTRWVGTGRTIHDNKGNPVKQYEPFFSSTHAYEDEKDLVESGFSSVLRYDPLGRLVRTDHPDGTFATVGFTPWEQVASDRNDTVLDSVWYSRRQMLSAGDPDRQASDRAAAHARTPGVAHLDTLGRTFLTLEDNGGGEHFPTTVDLDIEGNPLSITDGRGNVALRRGYSLTGGTLREESPDAGTRRMLANVAGQPIRSWDSRGHRTRHVYDALMRRTDLFVRTGDREILAERVIYGDSPVSGLTSTQMVAANLRGRVFRQLDGAGVVTSVRFDFKGNPLESERQLAELRPDSPGVLDWSAAPPLESERFTSHTAFDALNRAILFTFPDGSATLPASVARPAFNEANLLEELNVRIRGATAETQFVANIDYDAKGQRQRIVYGNGARTDYTYDPRTLRLVRLLTTRSGSSAAVQDLTYNYDPVGNISHIGDAAQPSIFFDGAMVTAAADYVYDPLYRLTEARGREHIGLATPADGRRPQYDSDDRPRLAIVDPADKMAMRNYRETFSYDAVGNLLNLAHAAGPAGSWTRRHVYPAGTNQLQSTSMPGEPSSGTLPVRYTYDAHGNTTSMPHLSRLAWNHKDQIEEVQLDGDRVARYRYDSGGQRVRKMITRAGSVVEERLYLGGFEIFRRRGASGLKLERQTLHVMDDQRRIALVETKTVDSDSPFDPPDPVLRYQLDNHLGSIGLELDSAGATISYEEFYPYGGTSYQAGRTVAEAGLKKYRYSGKERDEETGFYCHNLRNYCPWLARWTSCDPVPFIDGPNGYSYVRCNPVCFRDPSGMQAVCTQIIVPCVNPGTPDCVEQNIANIEDMVECNSEGTDTGTPTSNLKPTTDNDAPRSGINIGAAHSGLGDELGPTGGVGVGIVALAVLGPLIGPLLAPLVPLARVSTPFAAAALVESSDDAPGLAQVANIATFGYASSPLTAASKEFGTLREVEQSFAAPSAVEPLGEIIEAEGAAAALPAETSVVQEAVPPEGAWIRFSRSEAEANAFEQTMQQIEGRVPAPPPSLGGPNPQGGPSKWGSRFSNRSLDPKGKPGPKRPPELPVQADPDYYREYTVVFPGQTPPRGVYRIVTGNGGEVYTSWTHYGTKQWYWPISPLDPLPRVTLLRAR